VKFKLEVAEDGYQLVCGDVESGVTDYEDEATVEVEGITYGVVLDSPEDAAAAIIYQYRDDITPEISEEEFEYSDDEEETEDAAPDEDDEESTVA
jgi:uncharacterized protein YneR